MVTTVGSPDGDDPGTSGCGGGCGAGPTEPVARVALGPSARTFEVSGLDCAEEVRILERAVGPVVGGKERLAFDVLNGRMNVAEAADDVSDAAIGAAVGATGMRATRVGDGAAGAAGGAPPGPSKALMTALSGAALALGLALHALGVEGPMSWTALVGAHDGAPMPWLEGVAWLAATGLGVWHVLPKAWYAVKSRSPDMNLLMVIAVVGAIAIGEWFEAATVAFLFALSLLLESWSVGRARRAVEALLDLAPATVRVVDDGGRERDVPAAEVRPGARFVVRAGDRIALDGEVVDGEGAVDQAPITGESVPVAKGPGDEVFAGTINGEGTLTVRASREASDTVLARITRSIGDAYAKRSASEQWVDRFARVYTPAVIVLAALVLVVPPLAFGAPWQPWIYNALVLLVIACPCALVISTPVSIVAALASSARGGVLVKGGTWMELPGRLEALALDKTGTLTSGEPRVERLLPLDGRSEDALLRDAAALERRSSHPLARAILDEAAAHGLDAAPADAVSVRAGKGIEGRVDGRPLWLGSPRFAAATLGEDGLEPAVTARVFALESSGRTVVVVGEGRRALGLIGLADAVRPEAAAVVAELRSLGVKEIVMLTGDNPATARAVAEAVGIDVARAALLPEDKVAEVEALVARHGVVAMIGDGVNDAPAMARASFGIAMGAIGSDAAIETADIALMGDELERLPWLVRHSRRTLRIIRQNIAFSLGLKALFVALTIGGVASLWGAIAADVGATLLVVANALRLLRAGPVGPGAGGAGRSAVAGARATPVRLAGVRPDGPAPIEAPAR